MKIIKSLLLSLVFGLVLAVSVGSAETKCKTVNGHIKSQVVTELPNGDACPSPLGLCTVGKFFGGIQGDFVFVAEDLVFNPDVDNPQVQFTTGVITLETKDGGLTLRDASSVSFGPDGLFASVQTIAGGTGDLEGASGRLRAYGVFQGGCVDCDYRGEVCTP